jgi:cysteine-rich repeat protein
MSCRGNFGSFASRWLCSVAVIVSAFLLSAVPASAHQNPQGCTGNNVGINIAKNKSEIVSGETVHYTVQVRNDDAGGCDVTGVQVTFFCPAADGSPTGTSSACGPLSDFLFGTPLSTLCEKDCVVTVNAGVTQATAEANNLNTGIVHDIASDVDIAHLDKTVSVQVMFCGDNAVNVPGETCDPPGSTAGASGNTCRADCTVCGDGHVDAGEQCDDGNGANGDGCENNCTLTCPACDDGNPCNGVETCNTATGQCVPGTPLNCNDGNACTDDSCIPQTGCVHTPAATCGKNFSIGPSSMEGALLIHPGDWISGGYIFKFISNTHGDTAFTVNATVTVPVVCPDSSVENIVIPLGAPGQLNGGGVASFTYNIAAGDTSKHATGDQNSILAWEGAVQAPAALCGGNPGKNTKGAIFNANVLQNPQVGLVDFQFHYRDPAAKGKPNTNCTDASDPNRNRADVCGASWSSTFRDP